jgi:SNF2 family DNA or RNA helicase
MEMKKTFVPHEYQRRAQSMIEGNAELGLFLEMGLGKTITTLSAISNLLAQGKSKKVLVVAPLRVAQCTWAQEADKWAHTSHLRVARVLGSPQKRTAALEMDADIYVINRENIKWLVDHVGGAWIFDTVVVDELSSFKCSKTQRFKALRAVRGKIKRFYGLTGTPASNGLLDLWSQMYLIDNGRTLGKNEWTFRHKYFTEGRYHQWHPRKSAQDDITRAIATSVVSMRAEDYGMLGDRIDNRVVVQLDKKAHTALRDIVRDARSEGDDIDTAMAIKALQVANGAIYTDDGAKVIHDAKLDALEEIVEAHSEQTLLVFYSFKHDADRIMERFPDAKKLDGEKDIEDWNAGKIKIALAHPASCGHGLNLQSGGHIIVWFGLTWSLELYQQANARLHRQGQTETVIVHHIIADGTVDEDVMQALTRKDATQSSILNAVKMSLQKDVAMAV